MAGAKLYESGHPWTCHNNRQHHLYFAGDYRVHWADLFPDLYEEVAWYG